MFVKGISGEIPSFRFAYQHYARHKGILVGLKVGTGEKILRRKCGVRWLKRVPKSKMQEGATGGRSER